MWESDHGKVRDTDRVLFLLENRERKEKKKRERKNVLSILYENMCINIYIYI